MRIGRAAALLGGWALLGWARWRSMRRAASVRDKLVAWSGVLIVVGVLLCGPVINFFTMALLTPAFAFFVASAPDERRGPARTAGVTAQRSGQAAQPPSRTRAGAYEAEQRVSRSPQKPA